MEVPQILNELKYLIRFKFGINAVTPADCKFIAGEIRLLTKRTISETTVKRLFGFACIEHKFSEYTLSLLVDFNAEISEQLNSDCWQKVMVRTREITNRTLSSIKNYSGIPYKYTIRRKFAEKHFNKFLNSGCAFTSFISQPGWGKTILLSQLATGFLSNSRYRTSALLFLNVYHFLYENFGKLSISHYIKNELGIDPKLDLVEYVEKNRKDPNSKLVVFIDGFSRPKVKSNIKAQLFERLHRFIGEIANSRIQLVLGVRSTDWARFIEGTSYLSLFKKNWFPGEYFNPEYISNIPTLKQYEIEQILSRINDSDAIRETELTNCLQVPLFFESYYELKNELSNPNRWSITLDQIITHFIKFRVDNSNYFTEKMLLINKLINYGKESCSINRSVLEPVILAFGNAYKELLSDGILIEKYSVNRDVSVHFAMPYLHDYFLRLREFSSQSGNSVNVFISPDS